MFGKHDRGHSSISEWDGRPSGIVKPTAPEPMHGGPRTNAQGPPEPMHGAPEPMHGAPEPMHGGPRTNAWGPPNQCTGAVIDKSVRT